MGVKQEVKRVCGFANRLIQISKLSNQRNITRHWNTTLMNDIMQMIDESQCFR